MGETLSPGMVQIKTEPKDDYPDNPADLRIDNSDHFSYTTVKLEPVDDAEAENYDENQENYPGYSTNGNANGGNGETFQSYLCQGMDYIETSPSLDSPELRRILSQPQKTQNHVNMTRIQDPSLDWVREQFRYREMSPWERQIMNSVRVPDKASNSPREDPECADYEELVQKFSPANKDSVVRSLLTTPLSAFPRHRKRRNSSSSDGSSHGKKPVKSIDLRSAPQSKTSSFPGSISASSLEESKSVSWSTRSKSRMKAKLESVESAFQNGGSQGESSYENSHINGSSSQTVRNGASSSHKGPDSWLQGRGTDPKQSAIMALLMAPVDSKPKVNAKPNVQLNGHNTTHLKESNGDSSVIRSLLKAPMTSPMKPVTSLTKPVPSKSTPVKSSPVSDRPHPERGVRDEDRASSKILELLTAPLPPPKPNPLADRPVLMNLLKEALPPQNSGVSSSYRQNGRNQNGRNPSTAYGSSRTLRELLSAPLTALNPLVAAQLHNQTENDCDDRVKSEPVEIFQCEQCERQFTEEAEYWAHSVTHDSDTTVMCFECGDEFSGMDNLWRHKAENHGTSGAVVKTESLFVKSKNHDVDRFEAGFQDSIRIKDSSSDQVFFVERNKDYDSD